MHKLYPGGFGGRRGAVHGEEFIAKLATLPLLHQPGTVWDYSLSIDVLGLVVEKVSGKRLGDYLKEAVWDKVKMPDTTFDVCPTRSASGSPSRCRTTRSRAGAEIERLDQAGRSSTARGSCALAPSATICASGRCCSTAACSTASAC